MRPLKPLNFTAAWYASDLEERRESFPLRVIAVHDHVLNLEVERRPRLLMITGPGLARGPASVGLGAEYFNRLKEVVGENTPGAFQPGLVRLDGKGNAVEIRWAGKTAVSFTPPPDLKGSPDRAKAAVLQYLNWLPRTGIASASGVLLGVSGGDAYFRAAIGANFPVLLNAVLTSNQQDFQFSCRNLIGLGRGATPTGDDLVYGALASFHYYMAMKRIIPEIPAYPGDYRSRTTLLGLHMLEMGRQGLAPEPVRNFLISLSQGKPSYPILHRICQIGSSTGYDITVAALLLLRWALERHH